ncbi:MAG: ankyrin repeat domain-containing protein [Pseudomonadota bacterium]
MNDIKDEEIINKYRNFENFRDYTINSFEDSGVDGDTPLHFAAFIGDVDAVRVMVPLVKSLDRGGGIGNTPLHYAVLGGNAEIVGFLLSSGADLRIENDYGDTALDMVDRNKEEVMDAVAKYLASIP